MSGWYCGCNGGEGVIYVLTDTHPHQLKRLCNVCLVRVCSVCLVRVCGVCVW